MVLGSVQILPCGAPRFRPARDHAAAPRAPGPRHLRADRRALARRGARARRRIAAEVIGARYAAIGVLAPDGRLLESFTTHGIDAEQRALIGTRPAGTASSGLVIREARPIRLPDLTKHPDSYGFPPHHPPMHSFLGRPDRGPKRGVFGNLYLTEKIGGELFTDEDEHIAVLARGQHRRGGGERAPARGERPAAGGGAAAPSDPGALLRHGEPRAAERAGGGVRLGGDAGAEEGSRPPSRGRPSRCSTRRSRRSA